MSGHAVNTGLVHTPEANGKLENQQLILGHLRWREESMTCSEATKVIRREKDIHQGQLPFRKPGKLQAAQRKVKGW